MALKTTSRLLRAAVAGTLSAALLAPAAAPAADRIVMAGPLKVRDYELNVVGIGNVLSVAFSRTAGASTQQHAYAFTSGAKVTPRAIKADLGRYGAIALKLSGAKRGTGSVPPGCTGKPGATKKGTFTGSLRFVSDTGAFGTVTSKRLPGKVSDMGTVNCDAADAAADAERKLMLMLQNGAAMTMLQATATGQSVTVLDDRATTAPASVTHRIDASGAGLEASADLATASVPGLAPFLTGAGAYEGMALDIGSFGTLTGSLTAKFDVIGDVPLQGDASIQ